MNIILDISNLQLGYIFFLHAKQNIIMDGIFSKIIYSNPNFTLNGIYFHFPLEIISVDKIMNKNIVKFNPLSASNFALIQELSKIEYRIIEYYKQIHQNNKFAKKTACLLTKQLNSGSLKLYRDYNDITTTPTVNTKPTYYVIKLSGLWENNDDVGITYKIIEMHPLF